MKSESLIKGRRRNKSAAFGEMITVAIGRFVAVFL
jgi:hypothetical protein